MINDCGYRPDDGALLWDDCWVRGLDADKDNLSDALETQLGTSLTEHDTDRDGLFDYYEVIGTAPRNAQRHCRSAREASLFCRGQNLA